MNREFLSNENATAIGQPQAPVVLLGAKDKHIDELLDQALADSFPASDPVSTLSLD